MNSGRSARILLMLLLSSARAWRSPSASTRSLRLRMFEWLRRWPECGSPCQRCAKSCPVQSIHPEGHIDVNECIYCMHCQELYWDDQRCPHMIQLRLKRERRQALSSPATSSPAGRRHGLDPVSDGQAPQRNRPASTTPQLQKE